MTGERLHHSSVRSTTRTPTIGLKDVSVRRQRHNRTADNQYRSSRATEALDDSFKPLHRHAFGNQSIVLLSRCDILRLGCRCGKEKSATSLWHSQNLKRAGVRKDQRFISFYSHHYERSVGRNRGKISHRSVSAL